MTDNNIAQEISKKSLWAGRIISVLAILFMAFDGIIHAAHPSFVTDSFKMLGYNPNIAVPLGIIELICLVFYIVPRTSIFGAILLTGYLGGAVATNVRVGAPLFSNVLFPVYVAIFLWLGLWLRNGKLKELIPYKK